MYILWPPLLAEDERIEQVPYKVDPWKDSDISCLTGPAGTASNIWHDTN